MLNPRTFPCPNCNEIINDQMQSCRFCSAPVDARLAEAAGELQAKANQACSDASYLRTAAVLMYVFLVVSLIPMIPGYWGFVITFVVVLVLLIRWQIKFGNLASPDPDYARAKMSRNIAAVLWLLAIPIGFVLRPFLDVLVGTFFNS